MLGLQVPKEIRVLLVIQGSPELVVT